MTTATEPGKDQRSEIDSAIDSGAPESAAHQIREFWLQKRDLASASFVATRFEKLRDKLPLVTCRIAILRSFTVEPLILLLRAEAFCSGIDLRVHVGDFNTYAQEILDEQSSLYSFSPDVVVLAARTAELAPDLWNGYADLAPQAAEQVLRRVSSSFEQWFQSFRRNSRAALIVHNLEQPLQPSTGLLDAQLPVSQSEIVRQINRDLRLAASSCTGVYILDYDALVSRYGRARWHDERKWLMARMPITADHLVHLSQEWLRFLVPLTGKVAKALVVDLDNTLWGGIIGEDGMTGIKLGSEYPGAAFQALQRAMLDLSRRGILLTICSKNNPEDAMEVLQNHPSMLVRPKDFAAMRISWNEKAQGLREIAKELNIGTDALAFLDDNPVEREHVRSALPEVTVIDLPADPLRYAATLRNSPVFERLTLSAEDRQRASMYAEQRERAHAEQSFQSRDDFFRFLQQEAEISFLNPANLARISQLTQKTNQFNLTTRRYSEQQLSDLVLRAGWQILAIRVKDRFGDHGLVGVAITADHTICEIDSFLLSCRVIGRTVETAFLSYIVQSAMARGCRRLTGWFIPTKKNAPARDFYAQHGFRAENHNGDGTLWSLDLHTDKIACPDWVKLSVLTGGQN